MSNKNNSESGNASKRKWLDSRRKRIEVLLVGCFERHGSFSKYVWKTKPAREGR